MRRPLALLAAFIVAALVLIAPPAFPHSVTVHGDVICDEQTGAFDLAWTVTNSEDDKVMTYTSRLGGGTVAPSGAASLTENDVPAGTYTLSVDASWPNGVTSHDTGTVVAGGECELPPPPDECPDLPGDQPEDFPCVMPPVSDEVPSSSYKCGDGYKTVTLTTTTTTYEFVNGEWVPTTTEGVESSRVPVPVVPCGTPQPPNPPSNPPTPPATPPVRNPVPPVTVGVPTDIDAGR